MFGWIGIDLLENRAAEGLDIEPMSGAFNAGLSVYRTYDPIVLRVGLGYGHRPEEPRAYGVWDEGDSFSISPAVSFAVNNIVSVSATASVRVKFSDTLDGQDNYSHRQTTVTAGLGVGLSLWDRTTIYLSGSAFAGAGGGASFGAFARHRLRRDLLPDDAEGSEPERGAWGEWWGRHRVKVWGIATGLIAGARVRDAGR
ncbi:MAG: hypothetical protein ISN29_04355 [Gammaproteobacteria bacterium AqS3]|nr:hypothetical protein [Gammaproteobacteria bacterium AqS3]